MDDKISYHEAFAEKYGTIKKSWQYISWHIEFVVILFLSVCKGIYVKDCIQVQSLVFQIIVDNISFNGYILQ